MNSYVTQEINPYSKVSFVGDPEGLMEAMNTEEHFNVGTRYGFQGAFMFFAGDSSCNYQISRFDKTDLKRSKNDNTTLMQNLNIINTGLRSKVGFKHLSNGTQLP